MTAKKRSGAEHSAITLDDVAHRAGVSRTAVSFVLNENGQRNKHVSEETREKVLQAIQDLHFQPHLLARALRKGRSTELVGILDTTITPFGLEVMDSLQQHAMRYGYTPVTYASQGLSAEQRSLLYQTIFARRPLAIITTPGHLTGGDVARAHQAGVEHIVFFSFRREPVEHTHSIIFPSEAFGYLAAQHLLDRGHRHLVLVRPDDATHTFQDVAFLQRLEGMRAAIGERPGVTLDILPLQLAVDAAHALVETTFRGEHRPTGIYAFNDEYGLLLLGALTRCGIQVPQEVAVVGTDNLAVGAYVWPSLTSITIEALDIGKRTVELVHALEQGLPLPEELVQPLLPRLIQRGST